MSSTSGFGLNRANASFGGCDISLVFDTQQVGDIQAMSFAIQREKAGIYVCGRKDPISIARGKRGIAGSAVAVNLEEHLLRKVFESYYFVTEKFAYVPTVAQPLAVVGGAQNLEQLANTFTTADISQNYQLAQAWYIDQLPPLDVTVIAMNEHGQAMEMRILGFEAMNEGTGFSVESMSMETQMTWLAIGIWPWKKIGQFGNATDLKLTDTSKFTPAS